MISGLGIDASNICSEERTLEAAGSLDCWAKVDEGVTIYSHDDLTGSRVARSLL